MWGWRLFSLGGPLPLHTSSLPPPITLTFDLASLHLSELYIPGYVQLPLFFFYGFSLPSSYLWLSRGGAVLPPCLCFPLSSPPHFSSALPVPRLSTLQLLSPFFCFLHYLSPPPPGVLTGMTGSRLGLGAGRGRGKGAARTPAAEQPPPHKPRTCGPARRLESPPLA